MENAAGGTTGGTVMTKKMRIRASIAALNSHALSVEGAAPEPCAWRN